MGEDALHRLGEGMPLRVEEDMRRAVAGRYTAEVRPFSLFRLAVLFFCTRRGKKNEKISIANVEIQERQTEKSEFEGKN